MTRAAAAPADGPVTRRSGRLRAGRDWWWSQWNAHPRLALALRAGLAASAAWALARVLPGPAADYPYYAPFGAVVATTFSLAGSVKESVQAVASIGAGGLVGALVGLIPADDSPLAVALAVTAGVVVAGWRWLGPMGGWAPTAAIFTLIIGRGEAWYAGAYAGLTLLGAVVGIGVNALLPPLPLAPAERASQLLRRSLADELDDLAEVVGSPERPSMAEWDRQHHRVPQERAQLNAAVGEVELATRRNRRARHYETAIAEIRREAHVLDRLVLTTRDLSDLLLHDGVRGEDASRVVTLGEEMAPAVIQAIRTIADTLRNDRPAPAEGAADGAPGTDDARDAVHAARQFSNREDDQIFVDGLLLSLRRAADALR
ncbi:hypothetical protein V2J52_01775 [Georgenia sp. MJ173]|uniref:hypothetical protein n=1 Tax=Georgenia sunbinii TaxID=3117728 RepID=UPI002F265C73